MPGPKQPSPPAAVLTFLAFLLLLPVAAAAQPGTVSGTVTDASSGLPIANISVRVFSTTFAQLGQAVTNGSGNYSIPGVPAGRHLLLAGVDQEGAPNSQAGYIAEVYPDVQCVAATCGLLAGAGELITVTAGGTTSGINLALTMGGADNGHHQKRGHRKSGPERERRGVRQIPGFHVRIRPDRVGRV